MNSNPNSENTASTFCPVPYATVLKEGWERVVKVSKTSLDLAVEGNAEALASYEKVLKVPTPFLFDLAGRALRGYVTFQKSLLDLAAEPGPAAIEATEAHSQDPSDAETGIIQQSLDCIALQTRAESDTQQASASSASIQEDPELDSVQLRMLAKEIVDFAILPLTKPIVH
jgi:hypothetical protein